MGGPLVGVADYRLDHVEWHWGENDSLGGEHVIDGVRWVHSPETSSNVA
jgi:hypothetical protein